MSHTDLFKPSVGRVPTAAPTRRRHDDGEAHPLMWNHLYPQYQTFSVRWPVYTLVHSVQLDRFKGLREFWASCFSSLLFHLCRLMLEMKDKQNNMLKSGSSSTFQASAELNYFWESVPSCSSNPGGRIKELKCVQSEHLDFTADVLWWFKEA